MCSRYEYLIDRFHAALKFCKGCFVLQFTIFLCLSSGNYTPRPQQLGNIQYGATQGYGPGPGGQQNPQPNNMGPGQYQGRPMPNHVPQFPYQVSAVCTKLSRLCIKTFCLKTCNCCLQMQPLLCSGEVNMFLWQQILMEQ